MELLSAVTVLLTVHNYTGIPQTGAPVRGGVPLPIGSVKECQIATLLHSNGRSVPCHVRPTARWHDGSVKWVLVDALVDVPADGETQLKLILGEARKHSGPKVAVAETADSVTIDTGPSRFLFSKRQFGLPFAAWADLNGDGKTDTKVVSAGGEFVCEVEHTPPGPPEEENWLRDAAGGDRERFTADASGDYKAEVENSNDLHAVVKLSGWLVNTNGRRLLKYVVRAHAYAGRPELRIVHTFVYAGKPKEDFIRNLSLRFPWQPRGGVSYQLGAETAQAGNLKGNDRVNLFEVGPKKIYHLAPHTLDKTVGYSLTCSGAAIANGKDAAGWATIADGKSSLSVAVRNFWQMHPKELQLDFDGMTVYLWPESGGKVLDLRRRSDEVDNVYHYDRSLWEYGGEGVGVTHEMAVSYGPPAAQSAQAMAATLNAPLLLECSPQWYADSNAFGPFAVADPKGYPRLEGLQNVDVEWIRHNQRTFHWDGMIDYGDTLFHGYATRSHYGYVAPQGWCSRGYVGWLCNDGTLTHSLFLQYLRTGDYPTFLTAEAMARHVMEVDTCHYCEKEPYSVGGGHRHDQQHWGNGVRGYGTATHGAIDYYLLTGDERAYDVVQEYANFHYTGEAPVENEDGIGCMIRMWEITGEDRYKQKADDLVAQELRGYEDKDWKFRTGRHFRFVSNTSVSLLYYLCSAPPAAAEKLWVAVIQSLDHLEPRFMSSWEDAGYLPFILTSLASQRTKDPRYAKTIVALLRRLWTTPRGAVNIPIPDNYLSALRPMSFDEMLTTAQQWGVNNVYMAGIHHLCGLPYAVKALQDAGMDEAAVWSLKLDEATPAPFEETLNLENVRPEIGFCYIVGMEHGSPSDVAGGHSDLVLLEDGKTLGPAHSSHASIRTDGKGRYSHWGSRSLYFSASDNSDPRKNGREYRVVYKPAPH